MFSSTQHASRFEKAKQSLVAGSFVVTIHTNREETYALKAVQAHVTLRSGK